ncbi:MAG: response regulator [Thermodesulfobacteriota bacterium]
MNNKPRILCVDDDQSILKTLEMLLVPNGYEVIKAGSGEEALKKLLEERVDLIIMDVKMPGMDGFETCRLIKEDDQYQHLPVILITGLTAKEERVKGIEAGAEDFISKPFDAAEILARVKMLLKAKTMQERRIGELLIEMGFITEEQLQQALLLAKEQKIKVGEALSAMGALDKDRIYWALSTQLNMNYIELAPDMIDPELVRQFPMEVLERLLCLPLYETAGEINFAIADPTDYKIVKEIKSLRPLKSVQLHLALPEKISKILISLKEEAHLHKEEAVRIPLEKEELWASKSDQTASKESLFPHGEKLVNFFLSLEAGQICYLVKNSEEIRLLALKNAVYEPVFTCPAEAYDFIQEWLRRGSHHFKAENKERSYFHLQSGGQKGVFCLHQVFTLGGGFIKINRLPEFSKEDLISSNSQIPNLLKGLQEMIHDHRRILWGGKESLLLKKCLYYLSSVMMENPNFPPPIFGEEEFTVYFPQSIQVLAAEKNLKNILDSFKNLSPPFLFLELQAINRNELWSRISASNFKHISLYLPFSSLEEMKKYVPEMSAFGQAGYKFLFFQPYEIVSL